MNQQYIDNARMLKALSDPKRLMIVDMLSCGEMCACKILESFSITQPTLSHDMRVLVEAKIVLARKEGKNMFYRLNAEGLSEMMDRLARLFSDKPDCICHKFD